MFIDQGGTILNTGFKRYSVRVNLERNISDRLKIAANVFGSRAAEDKLFGTPYNSINFSGAYPSLLLTSPVAKIKNEDGSYNTTSPYSTTPTNPLQDITATLPYREFWSDVERSESECSIAATTGGLQVIMSCEADSSTTSNPTDRYNFLARWLCFSTDSFSKS